MRHVILSCACLLAACPAAARATLALRLGSEYGATLPDAFVWPSSGEHYFDLVFEETGAPQDERLFAYDLQIEPTRPGVRLLRAEKPEGWVFTDPAASFVQAQATASKIVVNAINEPTGAHLSDITTGSRAARVWYTVEAGSDYGGYGIALNEQFTVFSSGDPNRPRVIPVLLSDYGVVIYVPEPGGMAALGGAAVPGLLLRRRARPPRRRTLT
jgi:hypothetical protein